MAAWLIHLIIMVISFVLNFGVSMISNAKAGEFVLDSNDTRAKMNLAYSMRFNTLGSLIVLLFILCYGWFKFSILAWIALIFSVVFAILMGRFVIEGITHRRSKYRARMIISSLVRMIAMLAMAANVWFMLISPIL